MGCDGGTIPKRHELVRTAKRPEKINKDMARKAQWSTCTITQQPLATPIVACELGRLYSKESLLEFLLDRTICETASHVRNLKDVKTLKLTPNPGFGKIAPGNAKEYYDTQAGKYVCPIVGLEMNGKYKFCVLWTCGCVLSERALKEVETDTCHSCGGKFEKNDIVYLNPEGEDLKSMEESMQVRREKLKVLRKEKKEKKGDKRKAEEKEIQNGVTNVFAVPKPLDKSTSSKKRAKKSETIPNGGSSSLAKKAKNGDGSKSSSQKNKDSSSKTDDKIDVTKSKVYKSLFTSSESSKNRGKDQNAHWVTYNPYHL